MIKQGDFFVAKNINDEGGAILQIYRLLSPEEQRIACAVLDGMKLQKTLTMSAQAEPTQTAAQS